MRPDFIPQDGCMMHMIGESIEELSKELAFFGEDHHLMEEALKDLLDSIEVLKTDDANPSVIQNLKKTNAVLEENLEKHLDEEEKYLFPHLGRHIGFESGPISVMMYEHGEIRRLYQEYQRRYLDIESAKGKKKFILSAESLYQVLMGHIYKEDHVLLPLADKVLTDQEKEEIYKKVSI
ncbi:hemerythrin domain-containing protein [Microaerobacter geothermalis]|uniref:hemerythrin domain-containing protein n=1 Tax=Microaerobacter geothermalis TaxID=674972 RepID=UPI001F319A5F|nr:hemerythrin domain-containing protein [Microaerobacter geothermalis]MCF6093051.1 hemerythrin domain-containing protein [Microaerobacter geothermalis]